MAKQKFTAPQVNPYNSIIQSAEPAQPAAPEDDSYRFNAKWPGVFRQYLQEMSWRNRTSITQYVANLINADMEAHPEWKDTLDVLNK